MEGSRVCGIDAGVLRSTVSSAVSVCSLRSIIIISANAAADVIAVQLRNQLVKNIITTTT